MQARAIAILFSLLIIAFTIQPSAQAGKYRYPINDAHCHFVNFIQETDGINKLLQAMDQAEVGQVVLFGLPVQKLWTSYDLNQPKYYDDNDAPCYYYSLSDEILARQVMSLPEKSRERVRPFICGFNPTDRNAVEHIKRMVEFRPGFWQGIGEILTRHDDLTRLTYGETSRADHEALDPVYEFAAAHDLPVWIHSDVGTRFVPKPIYLKEIENAVKNHPKTRIVWCHVGFTRDIVIPTLLAEAERMLETYPNLWVDLSWVVFDDLIAPKGKLDQKWVDMIERRQDRIMIGTDKIGGFSDYVREIRKYDILLDKLSPEAARKIASQNMLKILPKQPAE